MSSKIANIHKTEATNKSRTYPIIPKETTANSLYKIHQSFHSLSSQQSRDINVLVLDTTFTLGGY